MLTKYLPWVNDLDVALVGKHTGKHFLLSSAMSEPTDMLRQQVREFVEHNLDKYKQVPVGWGHAALRENIAKFYGFDNRKLITTNGATNAIYLVCLALLDRGDHVVSEFPIYDPITATAELCGASITAVQRRAPDYTIEPEKLAQAVTSSTKLILLTNLHNPTGAWLVDDTLVEIARLARAKNPQVRIVVDEVYHDYVRDRQKPAALLDDCFITLNSLTKAYGLGCLHCGWIAGPEQVITKVRRVLILVEGTYPRLQENINADVVESLEQYWQRTMQLLAINQVVMREHMQPLVASGVIEGAVPENGCIYFPRIRGVSGTYGLVEELAKRFQVFVVPGKFFGEPRGIRIGFGGETESLRKAMTRLVGGLQALLK